MLTRSMFGTPDMARQGLILNEVADLAEVGLIVSTATKTLGPLAPEALREARAFSEGGKMPGKIVLLC